MLIASLLAPSVRAQGPGLALDFNGTNAYLVSSQPLGSPNLATGSAPHTVEGWIRPAGLPTAGTRQWALQLGNDLAAHLWLWYADGTCQVGMWAGVSSIVRLTPGAWNHIAAAFDGATLRIYVNGVLVASPSGAFNLQGIPLTLGRGNPAGGGGANERCFAGRLDEVRIWNVARTTQQIQANFNRPLAGNEPGLAAYYRLNDGPGTSPSDATGHGYNAFVVNDTWVPSSIPWVGAISGRLTAGSAGLPNFAIAASPAGDVVASEFFSDFSAMPAGMALVGNAAVNGGYLKLTSAVIGQRGAAAFNDFSLGAPIQRFRAAFKASVFGGSPGPGDGFSFNFVPATTTNLLGDEEGLPDGLAISFDTFDNGGGEAPAVDVRWRGTNLGHVAFQASRGPGVTDPVAAARDVVINLDADGTLDMSYGTNVLFTNLAMPYVPIAGGKWVLTARSGGFVDNHWIDDLRIQVFAMPQTNATDVAGNYRFDSLPYGSNYVVQPVQPGWFFSPGMVATNSGATNVNFAMNTVIRRRVTAGGSGLAGATVQAVSLLDTTRVATNATALNGDFAVDLAQLGTNVAALLDNFTVSVRHFTTTPALLTANAGASNINFTATSGALTGRVTLGSNALSGVTVMAVSTTNSALVFTTTADANGNFSFVGVPLGSYTLTLPGYNTTPPSVSANAGSVNLNFAVANQTIAGRVTAGASGVGGVTLNAVRPTLANNTPQFIPDLGSITQAISVTATSVVGSVRVGVDIVHTFAGDLQLTLVHPDGTQVRLRNSNANDDTEDLLTSYPDLTPAVSNLTVLNGKTMTGVWQLIVRDQFAEDSGTLNSWTLTLGLPPVTTATNGTYGFTNIEVSAYTVTPTRPNSSFTPSFRELPTAATNADFTMGTTFIAGRVTAGAVGLPGVTIFVEGPRGPAGSTVTDSTGRYLALGLPPDTYSVRPFLYGYGFDPSQTDNVTAGVSNINFTVIAYPIAGRITDINSDAVPDVVVDQGGRGGLSDANGDYVIPNVPPGSNYVVTPILPAGYVFNPATRPASVGPAASNVNFTVLQSPPTISAISNRVILRNSSTGPVRLTVGDRETRAGLLAVTANVSDTNLLPRVELGGVGSERLVTLYSTNLTGTGSVTVAVSDGVATTTRSFTVRVNTEPLAGVGTALSFDGVNDFAQVNTNVVPSKGDFTVECWLFAPATTNQTRRALAQGNTNGAFSIGYDTLNRVVFGSVWSNPGVPFPFDAWHHFAVVKAGTNAFFYLDGALAATRGSTMPYPPQPGRFYLGSQYGGTNQFWRGKLDELRVWRVARTAAQIAETRNARVLGGEPGLSGLWRFDEGSGLLAHDRTTNAQHAALSNGVAWVKADVVFDRYVVPEDNSIADTLTSFDADGDALTYELNGPPAKGTLTLDDEGALLYVPNRDATGSDSFAFAVNDGFADSSLRVINIMLQPDTNAPTISSVPDQLMTEDTVLGPIEFDIADLETAASNLTVTATSSNPILVPNAGSAGTPAGGLLLGGTGATRTLTLAPATNQFGVALITLVVSDGRLTAAKTFVLTVTNVNDAPTITALTNQLTRRGVTAMQAFTVGDADNDPASLTVTAVTSDPILVPPANITFSGSGANRTVSVTPSLFASGQATITLRVSDGQTNASASYVITVNNPPSFAALSFTNLIAFPGDSVTNVVTVDDVDTANLATLALTAATSDEDLVPAANIVISVGSAPNERLVVVRPAGLISGLETVTLTLSDGIYQTNAQFSITYRASGPVYELIELNVGDSLVEHVNDRDQVIGTFLSYNTLFNGWLWETGHVTVITPPASVIAALGNDVIVRPFGINNNGVVVGGVGGGVAWWNSGGSSPNFRAFQFENGLFSLLSSPCGGNAVATDINEAGIIAGMRDCGGPTAGYWRNAASAMVSIPQAMPGVFRWRSFRNKVSINNQNRIAIGGTTAAGDSFYDIGPAVNTPIGFGGDPPGFVEGYQGAGDINDVGVIFGTTRAGRFYTYSTSTRTTAYLDANPAWGPMNAVGSEALRLNDAGDMLGGPVPNTLGTGPSFAIIGGQYYTPTALLNLVPANQRSWVSYIVPRSINNIGTIVGNAVRTNGPTAYSAFLMKPAVWYVGRPISPPLNYPSVQPYVTVPDGNSARYFFWSPAEGALYPLGPVTASVIWRESANPADTNGFTQIITTAWPPSYQVHVATAPVDLDPLDPQSPWAFSRVAFSTIDGLTATPNENVFQPSFPAFSVIQYLRTDGATPNPLTQSNFFQILRSIAWNDPNYLLDDQPATIGTKLSDPDGVRASSLKSGWVVNERARYDGVGDDRAYDRATQSGPIIPVNLSGTDPDTQLVVAFYHTNRLGVLWADKPVRYVPQWPANPEKIVIASQQGSGPLHPALYADVKVYQQPDANLAGFNPNEEHAVIFPANGGPGDAVFALRDDLNAPFGNLSQPYALLKYHTPGDSEWKFKVFAVVAEDATYKFQYAAEAGKEIQPPYPLGLLTLCPDFTRPDPVGPWYTNHLKKIFARSGDTPNDPNATVTIRYFYPLQPDFYFNPSGGAANSLAAGTCIPWLNQTAANLNNTPQPVRFRVHWPEDAPVLEAGRTLFNASQGLPEVRRFARGQVIYDSLNPDSAAQLPTLARLYDPLSARTVRVTNVTGIPANYQLPANIARQNVGGREIFPGLPWHLRVRLSYDPLNKWLNFAGYLDESGVGEPLLMPNVMSERERDRIKALSEEANFRRIIDELYKLTRNPNRVNLASPGQAPPTDDLLIGFTTRYLARVTNSFAPVSTVTKYFYGDQPGGSNIAVLAVANVPEPLGDIPKALTAGIPVNSASPAPGKALFFDGMNDSGTVSLAVSNDFTVEFWVNSTHNGAGTFTDWRNGQGLFDAGAFGVGLIKGLIVFGTTPGASVVGSFGADGRWHHVAATRSASSGQIKLYVDGTSLGSVTSVTGALNVPGDVVLGGLRTGGASLVAGLLDEIRVWNFVRTQQDIQANRNRRLTGAEGGLVGYWRCDETTGNVAGDSSVDDFTGSYRGNDITLIGGVGRVDAGSSAGTPIRYVVLAENDDPTLGALPTQLHVIQVGGGPFRGDLKVLAGDNLIDERQTLRLSPDFGGEPENLEFEWYYHPDEALFVDTELPAVNANGVVTDLRGWRLFKPSTFGENFITLGDGGQSSLFTLMDNWFIARHRGYEVDGTKPWSGWVGAPGAGQPRAMLAPGWIKRVISGLNAFDSRTRDFHSSAVNTFASMLIQAGERYEGDIALNPSAENLNSVGLIKAYTTVLRRGKNLSIDGVPPVDVDPANNALLLAVSRIADLYVLLGNEAFADAADPTIGFGTASGEYGTLAPSIFAFQNQLDSLLEEELALLRGRDSRNATVTAAPIYNRLFWNFTTGEGEVAYQQTYNVSDQNNDGFINETDARTMFPQGHGDAWGHYLTAMTAYYDLLRHPNFTWIPRAESVLVAGAPVQVDFTDERKFARAAAAKAKTGREIVDLTYRLNYVEDPEGQFQGYKDPDTNRVWGVDEWARRAGQGAYFDWLVANAILPAADSNPNHTGIQKIDRTTVSELDDVRSQFNEVQTALDKADQGLNPLGLVKGAVPFDIDPTFLEVGSTAQIGRRAVQGLTQFDQILERAVKAMKNATLVWDQANRTTELLRRNQDDRDAFARNARDQERDYKNRLIEIFGYPYAGDIGAGKTYPSGYDGPDLYHYMYVNTVEITGQNSPPARQFTGFYRPMKFGALAGGQSGYGFFGFFDANQFGQGFDANTVETSILPVIYPQRASGFAFTAPPEWGARRAPGELQLALSDVVQAVAQLKINLQNYDGLVQDIAAGGELLQAQFGIGAEKVAVRNRRLNRTQTLHGRILAAKRAELAMKRIADTVDKVTEALVEGIPKVTIFGTSFGGDGTFAIRNGVRLAGVAATEALSIGADVAEAAQTELEQRKDEVELSTDLQLEVLDQRFEVLQRVKELESKVRNEAATRLEAYNQQEVVQQALGRYQKALAEGERLLQERIQFRKDTSADVTEQRYQDMTFRIFRNDALQKYRAQFDMAARYVYLAATAYDYEINFLGTDNRAGRRFLTDIIRHRNLGQLVDGEPAVGTPGLCDSLARLSANWEVLKPRFGVITPQIADTRFSLREEMFRVRSDDPDSDARWREALKKARVANVWDIPEFRRYCRPFAPESAGPQPAIVIRFPTTITFGLNNFGWPLAGGDSAYDPTEFSTKIARAGIWFSGDNPGAISQTPRFYLVPVGMDVQRSPTGDTLATRQWRIFDQALPEPFPIGATDLNNPAWIPVNDTLGGNFAQIRRYGSFAAKHDAGIYREDDLTNDTRLVGRSAWNTEWLLIIPGGTLLANPNQGLDVFIATVSDIKVYLQTYSYAGD